MTHIAISQTFCIYVYKYRVAYAYLNGKRNCQAPCTTGRMRVFYYFLLSRPQLSLLLNVTYNDVFMYATLRWPIARQG